MSKPNLQLIEYLIEKERLKELSKKDTKSK